ncbi:hypothetical protein CQW23_27814 [Capsicum baccatum]|uniref:Disease resistance protein winged helix domain-containing protein n=1 Tax=Capsicum baccatum TaxID=33114 RepID=A0A2G2VEU3_CAPBA|nr:hypothetical protein CQW23_27814 [Capsicum baccatum]
MRFMDQDESWNLFKSVVFANEALPSEFETIGKQIAEKCHGLPLTIVVVTGLLKSKRAIEDWESVAKDVTSFVTNDPDEQCSHILRLSFNHLISDLKACLLYFGIFSEDAEIPVKYLMRLWMAEGFLNLESDLEREAENCLQDLIDRCLVLVSKKSRDERKLDHNVKKLGIGGDVDDFKSIQESGLLNNLVHLQKLETLSLKLFSLESISISPVTIRSAKAFPATLKKLKLKSTYLSWSNLDIIAELPNLEVLKLMRNACDGEEWNPNVNDLRYWKATDDNFPVPERLMIGSCHHLKEIPIEFAAIHTLQLIEFRDYPPGLGESAARIQQEQEDLGNNPVDVRITDPWMLLQALHNYDYDDTEDSDSDADAAEGDVN